MRLSGSRLTAALVVSVVIVLTGGGTLALWIGRSHLQTTGAAAPETSAATALASAETHIEPAPAESTQVADSGSTAGSSAAVTQNQPGDTVSSTAMSSPAPAPPPAASPMTDTSGNRPPLLTKVSDPKPTAAPAVSSSTAVPPMIEPGSVQLSPIPPSNNQTVQLAPRLAGSPDVDRIQQAVQRYFDSINQHDYQAWTQAVTPAAASKQDEKAWLTAYASTTDSAIELQAVGTDPATASVRFTSTQELGLAPQDLQSTCITWSLTYRLEQSGDRFLIGSTLPDSVHKVSCA